jgi:hypothetical protein
MLKDAGDPESGPCEEKTSYETSPVTILSVWYSGEALQTSSAKRVYLVDAPVVETVRIKFGDTDLVKRPPLMILNDASVTRLINPDNTLTAEGILRAVREQLGRSKLPDSPKFVPNDDDYGRARFEKIKLDRIKVTVRQ